MKNSISKLLLVLASATLLASCGGQTPSSSDSNNASSASDSLASDSGTSSSGDSSSSSPVVETEYAIIDRTGAGITITLDKTKAKKGETVTIAVALDANYVLNGLYANKNACTKVSDSVYTFVMGDSAVAITASLSVTGDVVTSGDVAISLTKQADGTYKGMFTAENEVNFLIVVGANEYGYGAVDFDSSYADIDSQYVSNSKATTRIALAGNGVYELTFDVTKDKPISIYRTGILRAPKTAEEISSYFCGNYAGRNVLDSGAYNVKGVNHVEYRNSRTLTSYTWDLYQDGSLAKATNLSTQKVSSVYKSIKDNVYTVVDEYIEGQNDAKGNPFDKTKTSDTVKYSGKYSIVDEVSNSHYEKTLTDATRDMLTPSHELHSVNVEMLYGYTVGYTIEDELKACDRTFKGVTNDDGSFTTTVSSWKNYQDSENVHTRYEYEITININADGTLKSGSYLETYYTESAFLFNDSAANGGSVRPGMEGETIQSSSYAYGYGEAKQEATNFDVTPYFVTSLSNLTIKSNQDKSKEEGHVAYQEVLDESRRDPNLLSIDDDNVTGYTSALHFDYAPSTALDVWEYGIVDSDDKNIVGKSTHRSAEWIGTGPGTTEITIGNHSTNNVTIKGSVTVDDAPAPSNYYVWAYGNEGDDDVPTSSAVSMKAGRRMTVYLWASPIKVVARPIVSCSNSDIKLTVSDEQVLPTGVGSTISSYQAYLLTIDASNITTDATLTETITVKDARDDSVNSTIQLAIKPGVASQLPASIEGTSWTAHNYSDVADTDPRYMSGSFVAANLTFSAEDGKTINGKMYKKGTLYIVQGSETYNFYYNYGVGDSGSMVLSLVSAESYGTDASSMTDFAIGGSTLEEYGLIGIYASLTYYSGADSTETDYLVGYPEDDEGPAEYEWFTLDA